MAHEEFRYLGFDVVIETFREAQGWGWSFRIGNEPLFEFKRSPAAGEKDALAEARSAARSVLALREFAG